MYQKRNSTETYKRDLFQIHTYRTVSAPCRHTHCNTHCNTRQHTLQHTTLHRHAGSHTAAHCSTLQHTATHCIARCNTNTPNGHGGAQTHILQHTATHCNTLQHSTTRTAIRITEQPRWERANTLQQQHTKRRRQCTGPYPATHHNMLQHTAPHTATHTYRTASAARGPIIMA